MARKQTDRCLSVREAIRMLFESGYLDKDQSYQIDRLRTFRNTLVHTPKKVTTGQIQDYLFTLNDILKRLKKREKLLVTRVLRQAG